MSCCIDQRPTTLAATLTFRGNSKDNQPEYTLPLTLPDNGSHWTGTIGTTIELNNTQGCGNNSLTKTDLVIKITLWCTGKEPDRTLGGNLDISLGSERLIHTLPFTPLKCVIVGTKAGCFACWPTLYLRNLGDTRLEVRSDPSIRTLKNSL